MLYSFEKNLHIISCSVNKEKSLLALSYFRSTGETLCEPLRPVAKYLTLLIEIQPINNVKVLKAVDSCIRVQFLYPVEDTHPFPESHLLVISEEKYIEQFHINVASEDGNRVVIKNSGQIPKDRVAEDFVWAQWDMAEQRLFYIVPKRSSCVLQCIQFYPEDNFNILLEVTLDISLGDQGVSLVNFGNDFYEERGMARSPLSLQVFTNKTGGLCLFYTPPLKVEQEVNYLVAFLHKGCSKTFKVAKTDSNQIKRVSFINLDNYVAVYLPGHFLHLINTRHTDLMCYHLFLADEAARITGMCNDCPMQSLLEASVIEYCTGNLFSVSINQWLLLKFLWNCKLDCEKLAVLHCALLHLVQQAQGETQIIEWICENASSCHSFDPIQEFIIGMDFTLVFCCILQK
ncbi:hypothetical protein FKM82_012855 [Ascaphus truei]